MRLRGAIAIYDDPADLLAHDDESPLAGVRFTPQRMEDRSATMRPE